MNVLYSSNAGSSRAYILDYLRRERACDPSLKVLDIGGAFNSWAAAVADATVDMMPAPGRDAILGDIHNPAVWDEIRRRGFNFCICAHVLEDIRDPLFVLGQIARTFERGYISAPNKHVEFSHVESRRYVGYGHHRWIYSLAGDGLRVIAKFPFANHFSPRRRRLARVKASAPAKAFRRYLGKGARLSDVGALPWWNADLAGRLNELAFIWNGRLKFRAINADYAGESTLALARLYRDELNEGL